MTLRDFRTTITCLAGIAASLTVALIVTSSATEALQAITWICAAQAGRSGAEAWRRAPDVRARLDVHAESPTRPGSS